MDRDHYILLNGRIWILNGIMEFMTPKWYIMEFMTEKKGFWVFKRSANAHIFIDGIYYPVLFN